MRKKQAAFLDRLTRESYERREAHPWLKRLVLRSTRTALQSVTPDDCFGKCQTAAVSLFTLLRSLGINSVICGGSASWLYGGIRRDGTPWEVECGFTAHPSDMPVPHLWLLTEFGAVVDVTCSFFHLSFGHELRQLANHDTLPMIWMKVEHFALLPHVRYAETTRFNNVDYNQSDDIGRRVLAAAQDSFHQATLSLLSQPPQEPMIEADLLDGLASLESLQQSNSWVARNSGRPTAVPLLRSPFMTAN